MPVAERINHQDIDRCRHSKEIRPRAGQDVPGVHVQKTGCNVDTVGRNQSDQDDTRSLGAEERGQKSANTVIHIEIQRAPAECIRHEVERTNKHIELNQREVHEREGVWQPRTIDIGLSVTEKVHKGRRHIPLRSVTQR